jgi:hypothetical protein
MYFLARARDLPGEEIQPWLDDLLPAGLEEQEGMYATLLKDDDLRKLQEAYTTTRTQLREKVQELRECMHDGQGSERR